MSKNKLSLITEDVTKTQVGIEVNLRHSLKVLRAVFYFNEWKGKVKSTVLVWVHLHHVTWDPSTELPGQMAIPGTPCATGCTLGENRGKNTNIRYIQVSLKAALTDGERSSDSWHGRRATVQTGPGWCSVQGKAEAIRDPWGEITQWSLHNQLSFFPLQDFKWFKRYSSIAAQLLTLPSYCSHEAQTLLRNIL